MSHDTEVDELWEIIMGARELLEPSFGEGLRGCVYCAALAVACVDVPPQEGCQVGHWLRFCAGLGEDDGEDDTEASGHAG